MIVAPYSAVASERRNLRSGDVIRKNCASRERRERSPNPAATRRRSSNADRSCQYANGFEREETDGCSLF
jgi:hypothetical protein